MDSHSDYSADPRVMQFALGNIRMFKKRSLKTKARLHKQAKRMVNRTDTEVFNVNVKNNLDTTNGTRKALTKIILNRYYH